MTFPRRAARPHLKVRVRDVTDVTAHMRQIELTGPDLSRLRVRPGAHLVIRIPNVAGSSTARRVYSIWSHRPAASSLTIRVALHDVGGPGCVWAQAAAPGDRLEVEQPRTKITLDATADFHLFLGDETGAVPLLAMHAALLRTETPASGVAGRRLDPPVFGVFESADPGDEMPGPDNVPPLPWVHRNGASAVASRVLLRAAQNLDLPAGRGAAYIAGESDTCRLIQRHLIEQRGWSRRSVHTQPQWAHGRPGFGAGGD
ncbi:siderophore-interacting protein [Actinoplanes sp. NPDC051861]|uniref:siderophore-interacting protein n=1 Tax=Actinoplanes sp. NPDC051861 TaxID=3155170 RepID=UPI00341CF817